MLTVLAATTTAFAQTKTLMLDDFEDGVASWTRNDKLKSENTAANVLLVDVQATRPTGGGAPNSKGAALFAFKAAQQSWASASLKIGGAEWAKVGARTINFWINADGETPGIEIMLRGTGRNPDGSTRDITYELPIDPLTKKPKTVKLDTRSWRQVAIPLADFRDDKDNQAIKNLAGVYLLQFVERGSWSSRFFTIDDLRVVGNGVPIALAPTTAPKATTAPLIDVDTPSDPNAVGIEIDFLKTQGTIRSAANVTVGAQYPGPDGNSAQPLRDNRDFRKAIKTLHPRFVRLDAGTLVDLLDSSRPAFDFARLREAVSQVRSIGSEPLISVPAPPVWGLSENAYASFAAQTAQALRNPKAVIYFELTTGSLDPTVAVAFYNRGYRAIKSVVKTARIGGINTASVGTINALLKSAPGLDFLSIPFNGSSSGAPDDTVLLNATLTLPSVRSAAAALDGSKWKQVPLYLTSVSMNAARNADGQTASDNRLTSAISGAWWASLMSNGSRMADQIFYNDAANSDWGLLNDRFSAFPAYYAMWMWNTYLPPGSVRVGVKLTGAPRGLQISAVNTPTSHNTLLVNTSSEAVTTKMTIRGFTVLRQARMRVLQDPVDPTTGVRFVELPKSPFQTIILPPYAVAVLQFIEPPKSAAR